MASVIGVSPSESPAGARKKNLIQVSSTKRPLFFYVKLAKRLVQQHDEVELSALGMAIGTVVTISEILKSKGFATQLKIVTSTINVRDENNGRIFPKAKVEILLKKGERFIRNGSTKISSKASTATTREFIWREVGAVQKHAY